MRNKIRIPKIAKGQENTSQLKEKPTGSKLLTSIFLISASILAF